METENTKIEIEFKPSDKYNYIAKVDFYSENCMVLKEFSEISKLGRESDTIFELKLEMVTDHDVIVKNNNFVTKRKFKFTDIEILTEVVAGRKEANVWENWVVSNTGETLKEFLKK